MIFDELSNTALCVSLRFLGAELDGGEGRLKAPPPVGEGKSRGPAGRGLDDGSAGTREVGCSGVSSPPPQLPSNPNINPMTLH